MSSWDYIRLSANGLPIEEGTRSGMHAAHALYRDGCARGLGYEFSDAPRVGSAAAWAARLLVRWERVHLCKATLPSELMTLCGGPLEAAAPLLLARTERFCVGQEARWSRAGEFYDQRPR